MYGIGKGERIASQRERSFINAACILCRQYNIRVVTVMKADLILRPVIFDLAIQRRGNNQLNRLIFISFSDRLSPKMILCSVIPVPPCFTCVPSANAQMQNVDHKPHLMRQQFYTRGKNNCKISRCLQWMLLGQEQLLRSGPRV